MSCPRLRFLSKAPSNWEEVDAAYVGVAAPLPTTDPLSGVLDRIALGALVDLSSVSGFVTVLSTDGCLDPVNRECALA